MMPMSPALIELLRCPETGQRLAAAPVDLLSRLESKRRDGTLRLRSAESQFNAGEPIEAVLLREDGRVCYLVQKGVALLLPGHGVEV